MAGPDDALGATGDAPSEGGTEASEGPADAGSLADAESLGASVGCGWGAGKVASVVTRMAIAVIMPATAVTRPGSVDQKFDALGSVIWIYFRAGSGFGRP